MTKTVEERQEENSADTYLGLRLGLSVLLILLAAAVAFQIYLDDFKFCDSISAYYYTPIRPVFVGSLCAIGAALIFYRGHFALENTALDVAGFCAFVVAFSPKDVPDGSDNCTFLKFPEADQMVDEVHGIVDASIPGLLVAGAVAFVAGALLLRREPTASISSTEAQDPAPWYDNSKRIGQMALMLFALIAAIFFFARDFFYGYAHMASAITLFVCMIIVVAANSWDAKRKQKSKVGRRYMWLAIAMSVGCVAFLALYSVLSVAVLVAEAVGIIGFAFFWASQTFELRRNILRPSASIAMKR